MRNSCSDSKRRLSDAKHARLMVLAELASYHLDELFSDLNVKCRKSGKMFMGPCPVHDGDKFNGWNLYPDGHTARGLWYCRTRNCQKVFQRTIPGLVRGILSRQQLGWSPENSGNDRMVSMTTVINYLCGLVGRDWNELKSDVALIEKRRFVTEMAALGHLPEVRGDGWDLDEVRAKLDIPSPYFQRRGYSHAVLNRYSVGDALTQDERSPMFGRAVVPILDKEGRTVVGCSGRSHYERCTKCKVWHDGPCPPKERRGEAAFGKWRHTHGFKKEHHLYNLWSAKEHIRRGEKLLLLESPGDVWRVEEAGFHASVGMFGVVLNDPQQVAVESSGAMDVYIGTNLDNAGETAAAMLVKQLRRAFRVHVLKPPNKDLGETPVDDVAQWLKHHGLLRAS